MQNNQQIRGYRILRKIGSGATSRVYEASKDGQDCALKVAKKAGNQVFMNEFNYSTQVPEAVAVQAQEMFTEMIGDSNLSCISYNLAKNGDFFNYIKVSGSLPKPIVQVYVQ